MSAIEKDLKEALKCYKIGANKSTMLLCGSILENALLDYLYTDISIAEQTLFHRFGIRSNLDDWALFDMLRVSRELGIISDETFQLCNLLRDYRNLIHPAVARRNALIPNKTRARLSLEALKQALKELDERFASIWRSAYIINITGIGGSFVNSPNTVQAAVENILQQYGLAVTNITTLTHLTTLIQNPPQFSIIVNVHGEIMPVPTTTNWRNHYRLLGENVVNSGWIILNIGGYPFFYEDVTRPIGVDGLNEFLSPANITANCMNATNVVFTDEGRQVINVLNMHGLPHALVASRSAIWQGTTQRITFLCHRNLHGVSAVRMGRGWFVNEGLDSNLGIPAPSPQQLAINDGILGNFGAGCALFVAGLL